jgi:mono/diheme cytochrome c family protein
MFLPITGFLARLPLLAALACLGAAAQQPPAPSECPQPRFTGKAPDEYYSRANPLPAGTDLAAAARIFRGSDDRLACATCHGVKGDGRGPMSSQFDPHPRNFQCAATINGIPDGQLFWIIRFGSPGAAMPPHPQLSEAQIWQLVLYLRTLAR